MNDRIRLIVGAGALIAAACAPPPGPAVVTKTPDGQVDVADPEAASTPGSPSFPDAAVPTPAPRRDPAVDVDDLAGASDAVVLRLFGQPDFAREEPPARWLQYRIESCVLDVFLYRREGDAYHVTHIGARPQGEDGVERAECLDMVLRRRPEADP